MSQTKSSLSFDPTPAARPRPRKLDRDNSPTSHLESNGGVLLPGVNRQQTRAGHNASEDGPAYTSSRRRRPKKLHRTPDQASSNPKPPLEVRTSIIPPPAVNNELEALKGRVESIEAQLHELLQRTPPKLSRRRQRQRKSGELEVQDESHEELQRLEDELRSARKELENIRTRSVARSRTRSDTASAEEEINDVEEIPRNSEPLSSPTQRVITMSGSYRLPIPFTASESEVRSVQAGISSAQHLARQFLDANPLYNSVSAERAFGSRTTVTRTGPSCSEWYGGYSMSLSHPDTGCSVSNLASRFAPISTQRLYQQSPPSTSHRTPTSPPNRRAPPKLEIRSRKPPDHKTTKSVQSATQSSMAGLLA